MGYNYIINPNTNRKVKTTSKLGKQIINNYIKNITGGSDKWTGSYSCKGLKKTECNNQPNSRCKWSEKGSYCRKTQSKSKKRGKKNWGLLKKNNKLGIVGLMKKQGANHKEAKEAIKDKINKLVKKQREVQTDLDLNKKKKEEFVNIIEEYNRKITQTDKKNLDL